MSTQLTDVQQEAQNIFSSKGYSFVSNISELKNSNSIIEYKCACGNIKKKSYKDFKRRGCNECKSIKLREVPIDMSVIPENIRNEGEWAVYQGGFISDKGTFINSLGKQLKPDARGRYNLPELGTTSASVIMAKAFKIKDYEKLEDKSYVVSSSSFIPSLEEIKVVHRGELPRENGRTNNNLVHIEKIKELNIFSYMSTLKYKTILELKDHIIFEDGNIWLNRNCAGGNRFLTFSVTSAKEKYYYTIIDGKVYHIDKLVCMAFFPIDGKNKYDDYEDFFVVHDDNNKLNNKIENLRWSYDKEQKVNKRTREVVQYENLEGKKGKVIKVHKSIASAFRETGIGEQEIRDVACGRANLLNKKYLWAYNDTEEETTYLIPTEEPKIKATSDNTIKLHVKINNFLSSRNYNLLSDINLVKITTDKFKYRCSCGTEKERSYHEINTTRGEVDNINYVSSCCLNTLNKDDSRYLWYADKSLEKYISPEGEEWRRVHSLYWVSNTCKVIGSRGESLIDNGIVKLGPKYYTPKELVIRAFDYEEKLDDDTIMKFIDIKDFKVSKNHLSTIKNISCDNLKNVDNKSIPEFAKYKIYKNCCITKDNKIITLNRVNNRLIFKNGKNPVCVDIVMLMAFKPYNDWSYDDYLKECYIYHEDEDYSNCKVDNLRVIITGNSKVQQTALNIENRINDNHKFVEDFIKKCKGTLISKLEDIKTVRCVFTYKCNCENIFSRTITNIKDTNSEDCKHCKHLKLNNLNTETDFTLDGILYKRIDYGWVTEDGKFINNMKEHLIVDNKDNLVVLGGLKYNAKHVIAKAFKIQYYEMLDTDGYTVKTKDGTNNFSYTNLYVWASKKELIKKLKGSFEYDRVLREKTLRSSSLFKLDSPPDDSPKEFESLTVYKNGMIKLKSGLYTKGNERPDKYYSIKTYEGKTYTVHRIICFLFNPIEGKTILEEYKGLDVNHKDGNKGNNDYNNLEWITKSENSRHAIENGLTGYTYPVIQYELLDDGRKGRLIKNFSCIKYAINETGQSRQYILKSCLGITKNHYKYVWEFVNPEDKDKFIEKKKKRLNLSKQQDDIIIEEDIDIPVPK